MRALRNVRIRSSLLLAAIALALLGTRCTGGYREDETECEQAMNKLVECCPGFRADQASCTYSESGCASYAVYPVFTVDESHCIEGQHCAELQKSGVCDRSQHLPYVPESSTVPHPVCP